MNLGKGNLQKFRASLRRTEHDVQFAFKTVRKQIELIEKGENFEQEDLSSLKKQETYYFERKNNLPSLIKKVKRAMVESQEKPILANLREVDHFRPKDKVVCCVEGCGRLHGTVICVHQKT